VYTYSIQNRFDYFSSNSNMPAPSNPKYLGKVYLAV